jgi:hypothetical protein
VVFVKKVVREKSSGWKVEKSAARRKREAEEREENLGLAVFDAWTLTKSSMVTLFYYYRNDCS